jgi:hypothetical protein
MQNVDAIGRPYLEVAMVWGEPAVDYLDDFYDTVAQLESHGRFLAPIAGVAVNGDCRHPRNAMRTLYRRHAHVNSATGHEPERNLETPNGPKTSRHR